VNPNITLPNQPTASPRQFNETLLSLKDQLSDGATAVLSLSVELVSGENKIRHNLLSAPRAVAVIPHANVAWWIPAPPDRLFLYIDTAADVTGDLQIWV
jgi:hypothetical protein